MQQAGSSLGHNVKWGGPSPQDEPSKMKTLRVRMYIPVQTDCTRALRSGNVEWYLGGTPSLLRKNVTLYAGGVYSERGHITLLRPLISKNASSP